MAGDEIDSRILERLYRVIETRRSEAPSASYTASLFASGRGEIARKTGEEAVEVIVAALTDGRDRLASESADLFYHLLVLWVEVGLRPIDVWTELARREGTSGHAEKASRKAGD